MYNVKMVYKDRAPVTTLVNHIQEAVAIAQQRTDEGHTVECYITRSTRMDWNETYNNLNN